jgi:hypothetical protein
MSSRILGDGRLLKSAAESTCHNLFVATIKQHEHEAQHLSVALRQNCGFGKIEIVETDVPRKPEQERYMATATNCRVHFCFKLLHNCYFLDDKYFTDRDRL